MAYGGGGGPKKTKTQKREARWDKTAARKSDRAGRRKDKSDAKKGSMIVTNFKRGGAVKGLPGGCN